MAEPTVKHFIIMRFFPVQGINYLYNVLHVGFLQKQVELAVSNSLTSLANQTNKNFEIVFLMNPRFFVDERYNFIFTTLKEASPVPVHFPKRGEYQLLVQDAYDKYDFVVQSRMDFDDFVHKDIVADTQSKINECDSLLLYGYCKGYAYIDWEKELYPYFATFKGNGHIADMQSQIWKSSFAKNLPFRTPMIKHTAVKIWLKLFLEKNGIEFSERMFQQNMELNSLIYFRHEFAHFILSNNNKMNPGVTAQKEHKLTSSDITRKQLEEDYGFTYELKSIE